MLYNCFTLLLLVWFGKLSCTHFVGKLLQDTLAIELYVTFDFDSMMLKNFARGKRSQSEATAAQSLSPASIKLSSPVSVFNIFLFKKRLHTVTLYILNIYFLISLFNCITLLRQNLCLHCRGDTEAASEVAFKYI